MAFLVFHNANGTPFVLVRVGAGVHSEVRDGQSPRFLIRQPVSRHPMLTPQILPGLDRIDRDGCADGRSCVDTAATSEEVLTCLQLLPTYFQRFLAEYDSAEPFFLEHENSSIPNNITHNNIEAMLVGVRAASSHLLSFAFLWWVYRHGSYCRAREQAWA